MRLRGLISEGLGAFADPEIALKLDPLVERKVSGHEFSEEPHCVPADENGGAPVSSRDSCVRSSCRTISSGQFVSVLA